jgi:hypothetical protein
MGTALCTSGCGFYRSLAGTQSPAEHAKNVKPRCTAFQDTDAATLLSPAAIDGVEPAYSYVQSGNDRRPNLRGARILVKPMPGFSAEALTRSLECHEADYVLRGSPADDADPYVLPGQWVDIDVSSEGDGFVVLTRVLSIENARIVLDRAKRFAANRPAPATAPAAAAP